VLLHWRAISQVAATELEPDALPLLPPPPRPRTMTWLPPGVAAVAVVAVRYWVSRERRVFGIWPDEPGQLAIARFLGSGVRWNMYNHSTWRPGFGTLIAPIYWFTDDPTTVYRSAIVVNAVLGGVSAVLLYVLARRLTALAPWAVAACVLAVALSPAILFTTNVVWSEALVQPLYLGAVLVLLRFNDSPTVWRGTAAGLLAVGAFATHSRMLPLAIVVVGVVAVSVWQRRFTLIHGATVAAATAVAFLGVTWYSEHLIDEIWEIPFERNSYGGVLSQLTKVGSMFTSFVGQTWYQLVTTAGIAGIGAVVTVVAALRRRSTAWPSAADARVVLAAAGSLVALSIVFMADRWRTDQIVYGRYNDAVVGPVVIVGLAALVATRPLTRLARCAGAVAAATLAFGAVLHGLRDDELRASAGVRPMILGLQAFIGRPSSIKVIGITLVSIALLAGVIAVAALGRQVRAAPVVLLAVAVLVAVGDRRTRDIVDRNINGWAPTGVIADIRGTILPDHAPVDYFIVPDSQKPAAGQGKQRQRMAVYQFFLPRNEFTVVTDPTQLSEETPFVFAPAGNPDLVAAGAVIVWQDRSVPLALWVEPGPEQERLSAEGRVLPS
jgi:hypothetical protein